MSPSEKSAAPPSGRAVPVFAGIAATLGLAAYSGSFRAALLPDDIRAILENPSIRELWPLSTPLSPALGTTLSGRPVANLSFALNYAAGGFDFFGYHLVNILILVASAVVLFALLKRTFASGKAGAVSGRRADLLSGVVALLWLLHPVATQITTQLSQRVESLMELFFLLTLYLSARGFASQKRRVAWHAAALSAFFLGLGSKEVIVTAPLVVLAYAWVFEGGPLLSHLKRNKALYLGFCALLLLMAWHVSRGEQETSARAPFARLDYLSTQSLVIFYYLRLIFFPSPLCYDHRLGLFSPSRAWPFLLALSVLILATAWLLRKRRPAGFALFFFLATLAPTSSILPLPQTMTDYRPHLGGAAMLAAAAVLLHHLARKLGPRAVTAIFIAGCALVPVFGGLTYARNLDYASPVTLWADTARKRPHNYMAHHNLGNALVDEGRYPEAIAAYDAAIRDNPFYFEAYLSRGVALARLGHYPEAEKSIRAALAIVPNYPEAHLSLGAVLLWSGRRNEALTEFQRAATLSPGYVNAHLNLGLLYRAMNRPQDARRELSEALRLDPSRTDVRAALKDAGR